MINSQNKFYKFPLENKNKILQEIERLLLIALRAGSQIRFPNRYKGLDTNISKEVAYCCNELDNLNCPWTIQNTALNYINESDTSKIWEELHSKQLTQISKNIINNSN